MKLRSRVVLVLAVSWLLSIPFLVSAQPIPVPEAPPNVKAGELVLCPNTDDGQLITNKVYVVYHYTVVAPGDKASKVKSPFKELTMPNALLAPIAPGATAAVGDILLTWWQSGSGMQRAIVVDAKDPKQPVVRYLDLDWKNPVKNKAGVPIGQMEEQLKPDTFVKITAEWFPGTTVVTWDEKMKKYAHGKVVRVVGDKVVIWGFAGRMYVWDKAACKPLPVRPALKAGDEIWAPFTGYLSKGKVKTVDAKIGRVFLESGDVYSLGQVAPLPLLQPK